jgi:hypothetical protein
VHAWLTDYLRHIDKLRKHFLVLLGIEALLLLLIAFFIGVQESFFLNRFILSEHVESESLLLT